MTAGVCKDYYEDGITSFVIVSSDSDFWGLISSLPKANFLVMYENSKCGLAIKNALTEHGIYYCSIDDFCSSNTGELKRAVLFAELEKHIPGDIIGRSPMELTQQIYADTRIMAPYKEQEVFCNKYVKTMRLKVDSEGEFVIEIPKY